MTPTTIIAQTFTDAPGTLWTASTPATGAPPTPNPGPDTALATIGPTGTLLPTVAPATTEYQFSDTIPADADWTLTVTWSPTTHTPKNDLLISLQDAPNVYGLNIQLSPSAAAYDLEYSDSAGASTATPTNTNAPGTTWTVTAKRTGTTITITDPSGTIATLDALGAVPPLTPNLSYFPTAPAATATAIRSILLTTP